MLQTDFLQQPPTQPRAAGDLTATRSPKETPLSDYPLVADLVLSGSLASYASALDPAPSNLTASLSVKEI